MRVNLAVDRPSFLVQLMICVVPAAIIYGGVLLSLFAYEWSDLSKPKKAEEKENEEKMEEMGGEEEGELCSVRVIRHSAMI